MTTKHSGQKRYPLELGERAVRMPQDAITKGRDSYGEEAVPGAGFEPARPFGQRILSPPRLPFRHPGRL